MVSQTTLPVALSRPANAKVLMPFGVMRSRRPGQAESPMDCLAPGGYDRMPMSVSFFMMVVFQVWLLALANKNGWKWLN